MRIIKFRAWDKITKQLFEVKQIDFNAIERNVYGFITYKNILGGVYESLSFRSFDDVELMQYTGINDCNGREIFEGDIVKLDEDFAKAHDYSSTISEVVWDEDGALFDTPKIQYALSQHNSKYFTVIGNIYETPQLI